ncbi:MAG: M56 family metallopeptidase [Saprospiraceae bacterium]
MNFATFFSEEIMHALGWSLIHSLWQGAIIALLLAVFLLFFRKSSSKFRYRLSVSSLFLAFGLFVGTFLFFYLNAGSQEVETMLTDNEEIIEVIIETTNATTAETTNFLAVYTDYFNTHLPFIVTLWLMGMVVFTLRFLGGLAYTQRLKHSQHSPMDFEWEEVMNEIVTRFKITQNIQLVESKLVSVPMVIGYLKPMILLPIGVINHLSISEVEAVLAHELAHIKRYDYLVNIIQSIIETLLFFHPAIWWISGEIRRERENCCDDLALEIVDSLTFAKALASLEQFRLNSIYQRKPQFSMAAITNKNQLLNRVQRILKQPQKSQHNFRGFFAALILIISFVGTSLDAQKVELIEPKSEVNSPIIEQIDIETTQISTAEIFPEALENTELPKLVEPTFSTIETSTLPNNFEVDEMVVIVSPTSKEMNWLPRKNIIKVPNANIKSNSIIKIKTTKTSILDNIVSITIRKDTSITSEIKEITIVRSVKDKNGKDTELTIEIKSIDGIKTVTTYENGRKLSKNEQQHYQSYIDESQAIASEERVRFSGNRDAHIRLRKSEHEEMRKHKMEMVELRKQLAKEKANMNREIAKENATLSREQAQMRREYAEEMAALAREQAVIERELAAHSRELAAEYRKELKVLKAEEMVIAQELTQQQMELKREMAEQALEIAKVQKDNIWIDKFKKELIKDGFLEKGMTSFKVKMDDKGIKVNGKKMTAVQEKKYIDLYKSLTGNEWNKGNAIHIRVRDEDF